MKIKKVRRRRCWRQRLDPAEDEGTASGGEEISPYRACPATGVDFSSGTKRLSAPAARRLFYPAWVIVVPTPVGLAHASGQFLWDRETALGHGPVVDEQENLAFAEAIALWRAGQRAESLAEWQELGAPPPPSPRACSSTILRWCPMISPALPHGCSANPPPDWPRHTFAVGPRQE